VNHKNYSWKRPLGSQGYPLPIRDGSLWFIPECFVQTGFKSTIHPTRREERKTMKKSLAHPFPSVSQLGRGSLGPPPTGKGEISHEIQGLEGTSEDIESNFRFYREGK
jgi:hypothetical protein